MSFETKEAYVPPVLSPDEYFMSRAIGLGWLAAGCTDPNPLVGAVVVSGGEVVGEGYHQCCGGAHAEVEALNQAGARARGGTLYVSLEPCAHQGRTPPCVDRIIRDGISRVVVPLEDPDPRVAGRGLEKLHENGVAAESGCLSDAALTTNLGYYKQRLGMGPSVTLKAAVTLDGKVASAPGRRDEITGEESRRDVHRLRANHDCVVVGIDTLLTDSPLLDCRLVPSQTVPVPVVLDAGLRFPERYHWISQKRKFYVLTGRESDPEKIKKIEAGGGRVIRCGEKNGRLDVHEILGVLSGAGLRRVLVEGGAKVFSSFVRSGRWDALYVYQAPKVYGSGGVPLFDDVGDTDIDAVTADARLFGGDVLFRYLNRNTRAGVRSALEAGTRRKARDREVAE